MILDAEVGSNTVHLEIVVTLIGVVGSGLFIVWQTIRSEARKTREDFAAALQKNTDGLQENTKSIVAINTKLDPIWNWWIGGRKT